MRNTPLFCALSLLLAVYSCAEPVELPLDDLVIGPLSDEPSAGAMSAAGEGGTSSSTGGTGSSTAAGAGGTPPAAAGTSSSAGTSPMGGVGGSAQAGAGGSAAMAGAGGALGMGGVGGVGGTAAGGQAGDNTAGTASEAGTGGTAPVADFNPPDTCDFEDTTGCEDLTCDLTCENCPVERCQNLVTCVTVTNAGCSTVDDPLCGEDPPNSDVCTPEWYSAGSGNPTDPAFIAASDLIECLCTVPRPGQ